MKHLLNGVTIAAALAIAAPVWAQTGAPMSPTSPTAPSAMAAPSDEPMATGQRHHRARRHRVVRHTGGGRMGKSSADNMASQLNQQELSRMQPGGAATMGSAPMPMQPGPRPSGH
jgi:hypothetical protein